MTTRNPAVVIIPTYEERENIAWLIPEVLKHESVDVLVVDDASPDGTGELADSMASRDYRVRVLHRSGPRGLGRAYAEAFQLALAEGYERLITMDADGSHPTELIPHFLALSETNDLVLGSRWIPGGAIEKWVRRRSMLSRLGCLYARIVLSVPVRDLTGGFKCYRREVLEAIDVKSLRYPGYAFQIETTYRALAAGFRVAETPITFVDRRFGTTKMSFGIAFEAIFAVPALRLRTRKRRAQMKSESPAVKYHSVSPLEGSMPLPGGGRHVK